MTTNVAPVPGVSRRKAPAVSHHQPFTWASLPLRLCRAGVSQEPVHSFMRIIVPSLLLRRSSGYGSLLKGCVQDVYSNLAPWHSLLVTQRVHMEPGLMLCWLGRNSGGQRARHSQVDTSRTSRDVLPVLLRCICRSDRGETCSNKETRKRARAFGL
eukprot:CAMPEP_0206134482 /NCGR_PEP_ID=MMETSP1473-20131121/33_1 /ASSEMBLY_ACC=CAM_ASM_001109 /TAXON_ID=1461547 /ORGANISM="Stichococcus sp, Strain RCC1054" /LENGTH=155 /DNA_ID=CAMNT_0053526091 /DNA_START=816 /DNA_END=1283 /DNA_ORIENTATION=+